ncbi:MAG: Gfo/Idh/MocA family oxidoreductase [Sediminibacterium sp.]|nr:Gfo/Idh/MocA family oxidoreductase [Sediminibacterium sp.]
MNRKLRMGMIGGGLDAFIGAVHRCAANLDGLIELKAGALSINPQIALDSGKALFLNPDRTYTSYQEMLAKESKMTAEDRLDFISIVTPNFAHFDPAMACLDHGFNIVIEKPITLSLNQAKLLKNKLTETGLELCLTHTYSGYPMVKQARAMIAAGVLGKIRKVWVEYPQGWLSRLSEREGNAQAAWRTDPTKSGKAGAMGDIGTHAAHLVEYITQHKITHVCADINIVVPGRMLDDDGSVLLKLENGLSGILSASQVCAGEENNVKIKIYGENGGLEWQQMEPNTLWVKWLNKPMEVYRAGSNNGSYLSSFATSNCRTPAGHPEGFLEAFANIYRNFALSLNAKLNNQQAQPENLDFPSITDGLRGMAFIETVIASGLSSEKWIPFEDIN